MISCSAVLRAGAVSPACDASVQAIAICCLEFSHVVLGQVRSCNLPCTLNASASSWRKAQVDVQVMSGINIAVWEWLCMSICVHACVHVCGCACFISQLPTGPCPALLFHHLFFPLHACLKQHARVGLSHHHGILFSLPAVWACIKFIAMQ